MILPLRVHCTGSINSVIFTKLTEVFAAMVDAAKLAGNWIVVDRTDGSGSATAELLLEMALARGSPAPTILVIDSLERLGNARDGSRSHAIVKQLAELYAKGADGDTSVDFKGLASVHLDVLTRTTCETHHALQLIGNHRRLAAPCHREVLVP